MFARTSRIAIGAPAVTANAAPAPGPAPKNCVFNVDSGSMRRHGTFRDAVTASTDGRTTDAPLSGKHIDRKPADRPKDPRVPPGRKACSSASSARTRITAAPPREGPARENGART